MANKITIEIAAEFQDNTTKKARPLLDFLAKLDAKVQKLSKGKAGLKISADDSGFSRKYADVERKREKLGRSKASLLLDAVDSASSKIALASSKAEQFARKAFRTTLGVVDGATKGAAAIAGTVKGIVGAGYSFTLGLVDKATAPARALVGKLNSVLGLAGMGISGYGLVVKPVQMQVDYENLTTAFDVLLGSGERSQQRIQELTDFAGKTPFTRDEIYKANRILQVYTGDALGATDALGGVKMVGDIAAGINGDFNSVAIWVGRLYSALEGGRPVGEMTAALQDMGAMGSAGRAKLEALTEEVASGSKTIREAWPEAVEVFSQYEGIMEKQSDKLGNLLLGLKSFVNNNFLKKIGSGISSELSPALTKFRAWRSENKAMFGEMSAGVEAFAAGMTGKAVRGVEGLASAISAMQGTPQWQEADLFGKATISWDTLIGGPFASWWDGTGRALISRKLSELGGFAGKGVTKGLAALLGLNLDGAVEEGAQLGASFFSGFKSSLGGSQLRLAFSQALESLPGLGRTLWGALTDALDGGKDLWQEYIGGPFAAWWDSGGKGLFIEKGGQLGQWLGQGLTGGVQALSSGVLSLLGIENNGVFGDAAEIGESFWGSFTASLDGDAISTAIAEAVAGVWGKLPGWAQLLLGGYGVSKAAGMVSPLIGAGKSLFRFGQGVKGFIGSAGGGTGLLGFGTKAAVLMGGGNLSGALGLGTAGLSALGLGAVGGGLAGGVTAISGIGDVTQAVGSQGPASSYYGWRAASKLGGTGLGALAGAAIGSVVPGVGTLIGGLIGSGLGGVTGSLLGGPLAAWATGAKESPEEYERRMAGLEDAMAGYSAHAKEMLRQTALTGQQFRQLEETKLAQWYGDVSLSAQQAGQMAQRAFTGITGADSLRRAEAFRDALGQTQTSLAALEDNKIITQKLGWKIQAGLGLTEAEQDSFVEAAEGVAESAQTYLDDHEYQVTVALSLLLGTDADPIITRTENMYDELRTEVESLQGDIHEEIQKALSETDDTPFTIDIDEQKVIQGYLDKIASITEKLESSKKKAQLDRLKQEYGSGGVLDKNSAEKLETELDTLSQENRAQQGEAYEQGMQSLHVQREMGFINRKQFADEKEKLGKKYEQNIQDFDRELAAFKLDTFQGNDERVLQDAQKMGNPVKAELQDWAKTFQDYNFSNEAEVIGKGGYVDWGTWFQEQLGTANIQPALDKAQAEAVLLRPKLEEIAQNYLAAGKDIPEELMASLEKATAIENGDFSSLFSGLDEQIAQAASDSGFESVAESIREGCASSIREGGQAAWSDGKRSLDSTFRTPFDVQADVNVHINPHVIARNISFGASVVAGLANTIAVTGHAAGGFVHGRQLSWLDEENYGESVIPLNPARRASALRLWEETGQRLGVEGGAPGGSAYYWPAAEAPAPVQAGGMSVDVGGVTVQITVQGGSGDVVEEIKAHAVEIAEQVAGVIVDRAGPALRNMPARA